MTLEEEFREKFGDVFQWIQLNCKDEIISGVDINHIQKDILSFISSREEKAREEGRKEGVRQNLTWRQAYNLGKEKGRKEAEISGSLDWKLSIRKEAVTQYKEELKGKIKDLEIEECTCIPIVTTSGTVPCKHVTWDKALSEVKKLL